MYMNTDDLIRFAKENGFFYQSDLIYGGIAGFYNYGSIGTLLKRRYENIWREYFGKLFDNIWEIETNDIMHRDVFRASRHLELFNDPITECPNGHRFRADKLIEEKLGIKAESLTIEKMNEIFSKGEVRCPIDNEKLSNVKLFNLMFPIFVGPEADLFLYLEDVRKTRKVDNEKLIKSYENLLKNQMFLRPETAQGPYVNFPIEILIQRYRIPLGLFIIGKAYRNEISPRNALLRMREFTQAELQIFFDYKNNPFNIEYEKVKKEKINVLLVKSREKNISYEELSLEEIRNLTGIPEFYLYFLYKVFYFFVNIVGIPKEKIRFYELSESEKSFYNMYHFDLEIYLDDLGWVENGGIHFRAIRLSEEILEKLDEDIRKELIDLKGELVGYDLFNHLVLSKNKGFILRRNDGSKYIPVELELSFGVDRNIFSILKTLLVNDGNRLVLKIPKYLAPIQIAVFPLLENKNEHIKIAKEIYERLRKKFKVYYDDSGRIGVRYKRQDEIGTPFCITVDDQTLIDNTVTVRYRDTKEQIRIKIDELESFFSKEFLFCYGSNI